MDWRPCIRTIVLALSAAMVLGACTTFTLDPAPRSQLEQDAATLVNDDEILILYGSADAAASIVPKAMRRGYRLNERNELDGLNLFMLSFTKPAGLTGNAAIRELERLEPGGTAGVNHRYSWQSMGAARRSVPVSPDLLYANAVLDWSDQGCPAFAPAGMIDGPVDPRAPSLKDAEITLADFRSRSGRSPDVVHGTAIAELLAGPGRLSRAAVFVAVVVDEGPDHQPAAGVGAIVRALNWLRASDVQVVNISLAGPYNKILDRAIQSAVRQGMILVAAAGNAGPTAPPRYPAAFRDVLSVTAVDRRLEVYALAVRGDHIDFAAPGVDVYVRSSGTGRFLSGTSIATPFVTSRILSDEQMARSGTIDGVRSLLGQDSVDLGAPDKDPVYGRGLLRAPDQCARGSRVPRGS